jgi:hypothetical protein
MGRVLEISGTLKNVSIARHVHAVLYRTIRAEWQAYKAARKAPARARLDFALGILSGFRQKLEVQLDNITADNDTRALIRIKDARLDNYVAQRYPRTRSIRRSARQRDAEAETAGKDIGRRLTISRAVEKNARKSARLLPGKSG